MGVSKKVRLQRVEVKNLDVLPEAGGGWIWNNSWVIREWSIPEAEIDRLYKPRVLLRRLREEGVLSYDSRGRVRVEVSEGDPTFLEIVEHATGRPIFAVVIPWGEFNTETNPFDTGANGQDPDTEDSPFETDSSPNPARRIGDHRSPFGPGA